MFSVREIAIVYYTIDSITIAIKAIVMLSTCVVFYGIFILRGSSFLYRKLLILIWKVYFCIVL